MKLLKIIKDRGIRSMNSLRQHGLRSKEGTFSRLASLIQDESTLKVEASSVARDVFAQRDLTLEFEWCKAIPCATPPHAQTYVEFFTEYLNGRWALFFTRTPLSAGGFEVNVQIMQDAKGHCAIWVCQVDLKLTPEGRLKEPPHVGDLQNRLEAIQNEFDALKQAARVDGTVDVDATSPEIPRAWQNLEDDIKRLNFDFDTEYPGYALAKIALYIALHAIARMHCVNIKLSAIGNPRSAGWKPDEQPGKFLREIVITSTPESRSTGRAIARNERNMRLHWIRGHYADYRKHGLFGKLKRIVWFPEHQVGSKALGATEHVYRIKQ